MNIVVLSRNPHLYSTQSIVTACRQRKHQVMVLDHQKFDLMADSQGMTMLYNGIKLDHVDAIIPRIGATATVYGAAVIRQFELNGVFSATGSEALVKARDKFRCIQHLSAAGIPVPKTIMANKIGFQAKSLEKYLDLPIVVKLKESTHGLGVILSDSYNNAWSTLEAFHQLDQDTLLQEFIKEAKGADIRAFVVDGKVVGSMKRQAVDGDFRSNLHRGGSAAIETLNQEEEKIALAAAEVLGLHIAGVDLLRSERGPLVLEVNASPGLEGIETTTKVDIAGSIIQFVERSLLRNNSIK